MHRGVPLWLTKQDSSGRWFDLYEGEEFILQEYAEVPKGFYNAHWASQEISFDVSHFDPVA